MNAVAPTQKLPELSPAQVRQLLLERSELALIDLREEDPYAQQHPLWAANLPLSSLELHAWDRIPRRDTVVVLYGTHAGEDLVAPAAARLTALGYSRVHALAGGLEAWIAAGYEVFRDVNVPSKAFGEWLEHHRQTPSLPAQEVQALLDNKADVVVLDARRFDEYATMNIPGSTSVPGAELVLRVAALAPDPKTQVIVNCAGRTRSIVGAQSLVNAGIPNPVAALRNGTIGWLLAGQALEHGAARRGEAVTAAGLEQAQQRAQLVAQRAGVKRLPLDQLELLQDAWRTTYLFDVRTPQEYEAGHLEGFIGAPGGQLVQETDHSAPVRNARIVLDDSDGVRAPMTASWLAQMGWEVLLLEGAGPAERIATGPWQRRRPAAPAMPQLNAPALAAMLESAPGQVQLVDVSPGVRYAAGHIPGAWFVIRGRLAQALQRVPQAAHYVVTCGDGQLAPFAAADLKALLGDAVEVSCLSGGTAAWKAAALPMETGETRLASARDDRYRRPYEGTQAPREAMQAYLDWEFGLVAQLGRDGTHHFNVL